MSFSFEGMAYPTERSIWSVSENWWFQRTFSVGDPRSLQFARPGPGNPIGGGGGGKLAPIGQEKDGGKGARMSS